MKLLVVFALVFACAYADLSLTEWKAKYGAFPTGTTIGYRAPLFYPFAPAAYKTMYDPLELKALGAYKIPVGYKMSNPLEFETLEEYKIPEGYRASYDPENFNDVFGFYPDYKK